MSNDTKNPPDVSIVLSTHNRAPLLARTLSSLARIDVPAATAVELIVIASDCTDDTVETVADAMERFRYPVRIIEEAEPGISRARNRGISEARADLIAFLDDDVWVERSWLEALLQAAARLPGGVLAGRVTLEWESFRPKWTSPAVESLWGANEVAGDLQELSSPSAIRGANFAVPRSVIESIGNFEEMLGRCGGQLLSGEETDFGQRALDGGHRLFLVPDMSVRHWIPQERATREYLKAVAIGRGRSRAAARQGERRRTSDCIRLAAGQTLIGATRALRGWLRRDDAGTVAATLLCHRGLATLGALMQMYFRKTHLAR